MPPTDAERLATLEAIMPRIDDSLKSLHEKFDEHLEQHRWGPGGTIPGFNGNSGLTLMLSRKTLGILALVPLGAGAGGLGALLRSLGVV